MLSWDVTTTNFRGSMLWPPGPLPPSFPPEAGAVDANTHRPEGARTRVPGPRVLFARRDHRARGRTCVMDDGRLLHLREPATG